MTTVDDPLVGSPTETEISPGDPLNGAQQIRLVLILGALIALGPLTIDMYLPALPTITEDLQTTAAAVQTTLTGTLAGLAVGQLLIGPLSDKVGRRAPLIGGVAVHVIEVSDDKFALVGDNGDGTEDDAKAKEPFSRRTVALASLLVAGLAGAAVLGTFGWQVARENDATLAAPDQVAGLKRDDGEAAREAAESLRTALSAEADGTIAVCGWADHGSLGLAMFPGRTTAESAPLMLQLRDGIQTRN